MSAKAIKTKDVQPGNQYGRVTKGSRHERYYSVQTEDGRILCEDWFFTLRGAKYAAKMIDDGKSEEDINRIDCDMVAQKYYYQGNMVDGAV